METFQATRQKCFSETHGLNREPLGNPRTGTVCQVTQFLQWL